MKNVISSICFAVGALSCKAQQIIPVEKMIEYRNLDTEIPNGAYLKDVNGLMNKYIGTWEGTYDKRKYTFIINKKKHDFSGISVDELNVRYLITTFFGDVIEDTRSLPDNSPLVIGGDYISKSKDYYVLNYCGRNATCGQSGSVFISTTSDNRQMKLFLSPDQGFIDTKKCTKVADQVLPTKSMFLTKQ
ncbi:hypothetical protein DBR27_16995 [Flavobacterium sp. HMWF030]|nr:hypothetical protein DBR27_16995 [Flavobacterium sp. HMWF030]